MELGFAKIVAQESVRMFTLAQSVKPASKSISKLCLLTIVRKKMFVPYAHTPIPSIPMPALCAKLCWNLFNKLKIHQLNAPSANKTMMPSIWNASFVMLSYIKLKKSNVLFANKRLKLIFSIATTLAAYWAIKL